MIRPISAAETIEVRWPVLRPGYPRESAIFAGDDDQGTRHLGAFDENGTLVGVASIYPVPMPGKESVANAWQLRGMATLPAVRGAGHGGKLVAACVESARAAGGHLLWCNARTSAATFYQKHGWEILGAEFEIPSVGPHYRMWRAL